MTTPSPSPYAAADASPLPTGSLNLLVLGSDSRSGAENRRLGGGEGGSARSDTAMVVHLDAGRTAATVVSIPRDTLVDRPSCPLDDGESTRPASGVMFNTAYEVGGPVCAVKTVETLTGVRMDHYLEIDFAGFARLVDALGGVTVTTRQDIDDDRSHLTLDAGTHHLDGTQALALARTRYDVGDGSDLGRIALQQGLVKALVRQITELDLLTGPTVLYEVADAATAGLTTDTGLDSSRRTDPLRPQPAGPDRRPRHHGDHAGAARPVRSQPGRGRRAGGRTTLGVAEVRRRACSGSRRGDATCAGRAPEKNLRAGVDCRPRRSTQG